ncbi:MAG TPA: hypothetical protein VMV18_15630, partial [bacterium]|nr:hypothetical protein [bacterium]
MKRRISAVVVLAAAFAGLLASCRSTSHPATAPHASLSLTIDDTRFVTREHFLAGGEMQISGEPFAEAM